MPLLFILTLLSASALAESPAPGYSDDLVLRASELRLHEDPYWHVLLHYHPAWFGGTRSRIDDPAFFLAPDGKTNPAAELEATIRAFFEEPGENPNTHPRCRFVARFAWLSDQLQIDPTQLPLPDCEVFDQAMKHIEPTSATLIFPSAYMNTPASMFGHTLLVFDSKDKNRLLSRAVNYAALTQQRFGPFFAIAGIAGFYKGYYSIEKYYDKVEQYSDVNHRDMWEYELDLSADELERMILHTWELQNVYSQYYFFNENCSYNLLFLLDAARPSLKLSEAFSFWVIPIDTVKQVEKHGLIRKTVFRPSASSTIKHLKSQLSEDSLALVRDVAWAELPPSRIVDTVTNETERIQAMDLAAEYTKYLYTSEMITPEAYRPRVLDMLKLRSTLGGRSDPAAAVPVPSSPHKGHAAARFSLGGGVRDGDGFAALRLRPANHELIDNETGFDPGAQIQFINAEVRYLTDPDRWQIESFDVVDVVSISPRDRFFRPSSWSVRAGVEQFGDRDSDELAGVVETRSGYSYAWDGMGLVMAGVGADARVGGILDDGYLLGGGPVLEWVTTGSARYKSVARADATWFGLGDDVWRYRASWRQQVFGSVNRGLELELRHETLGSEHSNEAALVVNLYF